MANFFLDFNNGRGLQNGTTYANAASALSQFTTGPASGDIIRCAETPAYNTGLTATFNKQAITVTLSAGASALFKDIYMDGAWTGATNVTATADAVNKKQGSNAASMAIAGAFTTGQIAYYATGTLDLSSFNRISFWIKGAAISAANTLRLDLCSDTVGAVPVTSYVIPPLTANLWTLITTPDLGALGSSIKSINLQALLDPAATTIIIDNVIACTTSGLNMSSLIGIGDGWWYGLKSLTGTTMVLDNGVASLQGAGRGWWNLYGNHTGTFPLYAINPIQIPASLTGVTNAGTELSGGWDTSSMTTQSASGYTFLDRMDGSAIQSGAQTPKIHSRMGYVRTAPSGLRYTDCHMVNGAAFAPLAPVTVNGVTIPSLVRFKSTGAGAGNNNAFPALSAANIIVKDSVNIGCDLTGWPNANGTTIAWGTTYINCQAHNCSPGFGNAVNNANLTMINPIAFDNTGVGISVGQGNLCFNALASGNTTAGVQLNPGAKVYGLTTSGNTTAGVFYTGGQVYVKNWNSSEVTKAIVSVGTVPGNWLNSTEEGGVIGNNNIYSGTVTSALPNSATLFCVSATGAGTYSGSGLAWIGTFGANAITSGLTATNPARFKVGTFYVESGKNATFSYQVSRNSTTAVEGALRIFGGIQGGIGSIGNDIVVPTNPASAWATTPPTASDYTQYSISTGTASESGVVEVWFEFYPLAGVTTGRIMIDSCTASQV